MAVEDPWGELSSRYSHNEDAQFCVFVEQFSETADLIRAGSSTKLRMALVTVDNLAEVLLHRHRNRSVRLSEEAGWMNTRRFTSKELRELHSDFGARVTLAATLQKFHWYTLPAVLDPLDESLIRVGHAYRSRVYHADHHNPTLLPLLGSAYLGAVGRAFVRTQPTNVASSHTPATTDLRQFGYAPREDSMFPGHWVPAEGADTIVTHVTSGLDVNLEDARESLRNDLRARVGWVRAMIGDLLADGMPGERFAFALRWHEFWEKHGSDDELASLDERRLALARAAIDGAENRDAQQNAETAYVARMHELQKEFVPSIDLRDLDRFVRLADRLSSARTVAHLFSRYQQLDHKVEAVERVVGEVAIGWDRWIQEETDRLRGK